MGSCISTRTPIIVSHLSASSDKKSPSKTIETIQTSSCPNVHHTTKNKSQFASQIQKQFDLSNIETNGSLSISNQTLINLSLFKQGHHPSNRIRLLDLITSPHSNKALCQICDDILLSPFHCIKCNLFICEHCFTESNKKICEHVKDEDINDYYKNILTQLSNATFRCINYSYGCNSNVEYSTFYYDENKKEIFSLHEKICEYHTEREHCTNPQCDYYGSIAQLKLHLNSCEHSQFECHYCKSTLPRIQLQNHNCKESNNQSSFYLPLRYCRCGSLLEWKSNSFHPIRCYSEKVCSNTSFYFCSKCSVFICDVHAPVPISRLCGCGQRLKGGIIKECNVCKGEGIGWYCNKCEKGISLCERCLNG